MQTRSLLLLIGFLGCIERSAANELETTIGADAEYFDNILKVQDDSPSDDLLSTIFLKVDYLYQFTDLDASFQYTARKFDYRDDTFDDRTDLTGTTNIDWQVVPNRLSWNMVHIRDRVLTDRAVVGLPSNEQDRKTFSTGPQLQWNFGSRSRLTFRGVFVDSRAESDRSFKSTQTRGEWAFTQRLGTYTFGLTSQRSNVNVVESKQDYNRQQYSTSLSGSGALASWNLTVGYNTVERQLQDSNSGLYYSGTLAFAGKDFRLNLITNRELTDSQLGLTLNDNIDSLDNTGEGGLQDFDIVERTRHAAVLNYDFQRLRLTYAFTRDEQDYQSLLKDEQSQTTSITARYRPNRTSTISYRFTRSSSTFQVGPIGDNRFRQYERRLSWRFELNSQLTSEIWFTIEDRVSDAGRPISFKDETVGVKVDYRI